MPDSNGTTTTPPERVTLARVAELAGVAESTASRVINGYTENFRVRPEVRKRVLEAARKLNYRPNPMVRSISSRWCGWRSFVSDTIARQ